MHFLISLNSKEVKKETYLLVKRDGAEEYLIYNVPFIDIRPIFLLNEKNIWQWEYDSVDKGIFYNNRYNPIY